MKLKKIVSLVLVGCLVGSIISGCGKRQLPMEGQEENVLGEITPEKDAELIFWSTPGDAEYGKAIAKQFEEEYGVKVSVQESGLDAVNKMMLDGPTGNGADVFMAAHDTFSTAFDAGLLLSIDEDIAEELRTEVNEVALKTIEKDNTLYGVPVSIETYGLFYNKDLVTGEPANTMEDIIKEAKEYNDPQNNLFWYLTVLNDGFAAYPFLSLDGFALFGENGQDNENPGFSSEEFIHGLERVKSMKEIMNINAEDLKIETASQLEQSFKTGKTAYYPTGPWLVKSLKEENVNFGVTTLPTWDGKQMKSFGSIQNAYVSAYTKYPHAAQLFAKYLVSKEAAETLYEKSYKITSRKDISNVEGLKDDEQLSIFAQAFNNAVPMPSVKRMSYYWTIIQGVIAPVFEGDISPEEGAKKAQSDFEALVASE